MRIASWFLFASLVAGVACGDDDATVDDTTGKAAETSSVTTTTADAASSTDASSSSAGTPGECQLLTVTESAVYFEGLGAAGITMRVDPSLAGYTKTRLTLELYEDLALPPIVPGTFDLTVAPEDNYGTCQHCNLLIGYDAAGQPRGAFFQSRGSMVLDGFDADLRTVAGRVDGLRLVEVTQSPDDLSWHVVESGLCFDVAPFAFDTRPVDGAPCERAEDCPNEAWQACDPFTKTCVHAPCALGGDGPFCPSDQRCMSQYGPLLRLDEGGPIAGACYVDCVPGADGCGTGETCLALGPVQQAGICLATGTAPVGAACNLPDIGTGCAPGGMCDEPGICRQTCTYLAPDSGCAPGTYCNQQNLCKPLDDGDITTVGGICEPQSRLFTDCGPEGNAFRGLCVDLFAGEPKECLRLCALDTGACPGGEECLPLFGPDPGVGACHPSPTCGDGELDLVGGELCDDGNVADGDGCSADCTVVDVAAQCDLAKPLLPGMLEVGSNAGGVTGYATDCSPYPYAPSKTYSFTAPAPGKLLLQLDSAKSLQLSALADCADATSELRCSADIFQTGTQTLAVNMPVAGDPVLVVVRGESPAQAGNFFLLPTFLPAVCGDGDVSGTEACEDGNVVGGDGCSADCSSIDWAAACGAFPALPLDVPVTGELDTASAQLFQLSATCSVDGTVERAYTVNVPADGNLTLTLASEENLVVYAGEGCGPAPEGYVTCLNWLSPPGEVRTTTAQVTAGFVTVIVEGYRATDRGAYTLTASFAP